MTMTTSRREFMRRAALLASAGAATPLALNLAALGSASAQAATGYKALVCLFLYGGNDHHNTVLPVDDATHAKYAGIRSGITLAQADLLPHEIVPDNPWADGRTEGRRMAFNPGMAALKPVFDQGKLALAMNVGTLVAPVPDYKRASNVDLPPKLFSHNDQQSVWQSGLAEGATSGWGGRMADVMVAGDSAEASFASVSAAGNAVFMSGRDVVQYQISSRGPIAVNTVFGNVPATEALKRIMQRSSPHLLERDHAGVAERAIRAQVKVTQALANPGVQPEWFTELDAAIAAGNSLAGQFKIVAQLIAARQVLGMQRQVFFVSLGGFDLHDALMTRHQPLLKLVADAMAAFYAATTRMAMQDQVTTFTGSDFGRTLTSNGDGSDHAWGSYHMVMGGAVKGRRWYGQLPLMSLAKEDDPVGSGRNLPAMAVDQLGGTLGRWMGLSETQLLGTPGANYQDGVFPNLHRFDSSDMGFMTL